MTVAISDNGAVATNGSTPAPSLESLRTQPENVHLFRGYGPLVVGIILFVLMVTLAPTVAPERVVERPVDAPAEEAP
jgi:hypothetical protein